jgi:SAM-dependent methyltransferase
MKAGPWQLYGIEISPEEAHRAEAASGAQVFVGDVLGAPFSPNSFDVITGLHILEHVYNPREVISRIWKLLKPGGVFYMLCPNIDAIEASMFGSYWYCLELPRHLYHFSPRSLAHLFTYDGFDKVVLRTIPNCYVERSMYYITSDVLARFGLSRPPLAEASSTASLPWRVVRKAMRLSVLWPYRQLAAVVGRGPVIEAAFRKRR